MPQYELNFGDYWRIVRKRKLIIVLSFLIVLSGTITYLNLQTPVYMAVATVKIEQRRTLASALTEYISWSLGDILVTEAKIIESRLIAEEVAKRLDLIKEDATVEEFNSAVDEIQGAVSAEKEKATNLINIVVFFNSPEKATLIANEVVQVYVEHDLNRKIKQARQIRQFIEDQLATVEAKLRTSEDKLKELREQGKITGIAVPLEQRLVRLKSELSELLVKATEKHPHVGRLYEQIEDLENQLRTLPAEELEFARLTRDIKVNEKLYTTLREKFEEAQIAEAEKIGDVSIIDYATKPSAPIKPQKRLGAMLGAILGLVCGFFLCFVVEGFDTSIATIEDVESLLKLPVLGVVPHISLEEGKRRPWWKWGVLQSRPTELDESKVRLIVHQQPKSPIAEAYRTLRTNLKFSSPDRKTLLVTSAGPKEGKTTVLVNLALTAAQMGNKTLIVSTDLRRPALYQTFGIQREPGLYEVLSQTIDWEKATKTLSDILIGNMGFDQVMRTPGLDNLSVMTSGHIPLNPSELLGSKEMAKLIEKLKAEHDVVFFDSPPALPITDAIVLAPKLDGVIIVYEIGRTARGALLRVKTQLEGAGAKILGITLNHIRPETEMYPTYYPQYYHSKYYGIKKKGSRGT